MHGAPLLKTTVAHWWVNIVQGSNLFWGSFTLFKDKKKKTGTNIQPCCLNGLVNLRIYYNDYQMNKRDFSCMTNTWYLRQARQADLACLGRKPEHTICFISPSLKLQYNDFTIKAYFDDLLHKHIFRLLQCWLKKSCLALWENEIAKLEPYQCYLSQ